jgi:hypothetical protein
MTDLTALGPLLQNTLGALIALGTLLTVVTKISPLARYLKKHLFREVLEQIAALQVEAREDRLVVLRIEIMLEATPWEVKLRLYNEYKRLGGNSHLDAWMVRCAKQHGYEFVSVSGDILE